MTASTSLASLLQRFSTERLVRQQRAGPHTIASYRDAFRLLLRFAQERLGKTPASLALDDLDAALVSAFLDHVEQHRRNTPRTRNVRLAAVHAFFSSATRRYNGTRSAYSPPGYASAMGNQLTRSFRGRAALGSAAMRSNGSSLDTYRPPRLGAPL